MSFEDDLNHAIKQIENQRYNAAEQAMLSRMVDAQCQRLRQIWAMQTIGQHQRKPLADDSEPHIPRRKPANSLNPTDRPLRPQQLNPVEPCRTALNDA